MELIEKQGYKQTELGWIPEDWSTNKLTEVVEYIHGKAHEQDIDENGQYIVANSKFISTDGLIKKFSKKIHCEAKKGDVLTVLSDIPNGKALAKCFYVESDNEITVNQRICIWRSKNSHPKFNFYKLNRLPYFLAINDGVNQTNIGNSDIEKCIVVMPSLKEQKNIATALTDVDELIANLDKLINKKKAIKQGAMQQLLTPPHKGGKRLKGFTGEWIEITLGDIGQCIIGLTYTPSNVKDSGTLVLRSSNIQNGRLSSHDNVYVDSLIPEKLKVKKNDILICVRNGSRNLIGKCLKLSNEMVGQTWGAFMSVYRSDFNDYVEHLFKSNIIQSQIEENLGATINQITNKTLNSFKAIIPKEIEEQQAITRIISDMDLEIEKLEAKKVKYQSIKQGMMQELLTGKTRLV